MKLRPFFVMRLELLQRNKIICSCTWDNSFVFKGKARHLNNNILPDKRNKYVR